MVAEIRLHVDAVVVCWECRRVLPLRAFSIESPDCYDCVQARRAKEQQQRTDPLEDWWAEQKRKVLA